MDWDTQAAELVATAYHEAGHAVAAHALGRAFTRVSIEPIGDTLGRCSFRPPGEWFRPDERLDGATRRRLEERIMISLAGPEAEARFTGVHDEEAAEEDVERAFAHACFMTGDEAEAWAYLDWLRHRTLNLMRRAGLDDAVEALATELLERTEVGYRRGRAIIEDAMGGVRGDGPSRPWARPAGSETALRVRRAHRR
jgi:hypothetical protein